MHIQFRWYIHKKINFSQQKCRPTNVNLRVTSNNPLIMWFSGKSVHVFTCTLGRLTSFLQHVFNHANGGFLSTRCLPSCLSTARIQDLLDTSCFAPAPHCSLLTRFAANGMEIHTESYTSSSEVRISRILNIGIDFKKIAAPFCYDVDVRLAWTFPFVQFGIICWGFEWKRIFDKSMSCISPKSAGKCSYRTGFFPWYGPCMSLVYSCFS